MNPSFQDAAGAEEAEPRAKAGLARNLERVRARIAAACARAGRDAGEVTLVAVTKRVEPAIAGLLLDLGVEHIGENRVAEAERKRALLGPRGTWHMIGHLQRNKVKKALSLFSVIHSVDSVRLMDELSRRLAGTGREMEICLEVNVSGEEQKHGFAPGEAADAVRAARERPGLVLRGLMTMAPFDPDPEAARPHFKALRALFESLRAEGVERFAWLSMGMSGDFEPAVEEGATHVRIGTALFEGL